MSMFGYLQARCHEVRKYEKVPVAESSNVRHLFVSKLEQIVSVIILHLDDIEHRVDVFSSALCDHFHAKVWNLAKI